jgi:nitrogen-specific signal transduction histidine kinase
MNETPLTIQERQAALDYVAARIRRYGLELPATLFLEINRPLAGIAGQAAYVFTPLFGAFLGLDKVERYATLIGDRTALDELIDRLEEPRNQQPHRQLPSKDS